MTKLNKQPKAESRIILTEESASSRQMSRKLSGQTQSVGTGGMPEKEKLRIIEEKTQEIRNDFFATYLAGFKDTAPEELKKLRKNIPWNEHMTVTSDKVVKLDSVGFNDDIQREIQFYNLTMENVQRAIGYLTQENIPIQRPSDYEVEMFKSPKQVIRIDNNLVRQQKRVKNVQEKRLREQGKRVQKLVKAKKMREEHKEKKNSNQVIEDWKKEIKMKGQEKAGDLNDYIKKRQLYPKKLKERKIEKREAKEVKSGKRPADGISRKGGFKKGVKQPKTKRPGKDTRQRMQSKKQSMK